MSGSIYTPSLSGQTPTWAFNSGPVVCGCIQSGQISIPSYTPAPDWSCGYVDLGCGFIDTGNLSGATLCGSISYYPYTLNRYCSKCGRCMGSYYIVGDGITVTGICGFIETWCWQCAGYRYQGGGFETREDWLRESSPFTSNTPCYILADWYEEQGRSKDAEWLRTYRSGR